MNLENYTCRLLAGPGNRYVADWCAIAGLDPAQMERMGYQPLDGQRPVQPGEAAVGEYFAYNFKDTLRPESSNMVNRWDSGVDDQGRLLPPSPAFFDPMKESLTLEVEIREGTKFTVPLKAVEIVKADNAKGYETSEGLMLSIEDLRAIQKKAGVTQPQT